MDKATVEVYQWERKGVLGFIAVRFNTDIMSTLYTYAVMVEILKYTNARNRK